VALVVDMATTVVGPSGGGGAGAGHGSGDGSGAGDGSGDGSGAADVGDGSATATNGDTGAPTDGTGGKSTGGSDGAVGGTGGTAGASADVGDATSGAGAGDDRAAHGLSGDADAGDGSEDGARRLHDGQGGSGAIDADAGDGTGTDAPGSAGSQEPADGTFAGPAGTAPSGEASAADATHAEAGQPASGILGALSQPSTFGLALRAPGDLLAGGIASLAFVGALVAGLVLLVVVPGGLLESTIQQNYERVLRRVIPRRFGLWRIAARHRRPFAASAVGRVGRALGVLPLVAVTAAASVAVDPGAVFDPTSIRLFLAFVIAIALVNVGGSVLAVAYSRVRLGEAATIALRPLTVILTVASVVVSRVAGFEPGVVFGLVIGVQLGASVARAKDARLTVVSSLALLAAGVGAWLLHSQLQPSVLADPTFAGSLSLDVLTAVAVNCLSAPVVALLPLTFLDGHGVFRHSKRLWAALYAVAVVVFAVVLLPLPQTWSQVGGDLSGWFMGFGVFALLSIGVWAAFRASANRHPSDKAGDAPDGDAAAQPPARASAV
jgi:hypothetical protein